MCCYSVQTFNRRFNQHFNESPHKWLLRCRLMLAAKIMSKTNISITELSSLCGFINVSHFIATFRRHFGITPASLKNYSREEQYIDSCRYTIKQKFSPPITEWRELMCQQDSKSRYYHLSNVPLFFTLKLPLPMTKISFSSVLCFQVNLYFIFVITSFRALR